MSRLSGVREAASLSAFRFNFDEYERMEAVGLLDRARRVELLDGRIVEMAPNSDDHAGASAEIVASLISGLRTAAVAKDFRVRTHGTLKCDPFNAPEPDVYVIRPLGGRKYAEAGDCVLVIEVSLSSLATDLSIKAPLYARAGIPELWIVEPEARSVRVFREPILDGTWGETLTVREGAIHPVFAPDLSIDIGDFF